MAGLIPDPLRAALQALRHDLHAHPELAFAEHDTQRRLRAALPPGLEVQTVAGTGLVARVPGTTRGAPTVALRGDMDALPITEATGAPFASTVPGRMHACGHDMHATWVVGAAHLLAADPAPGDVVILLQPAEEVGQGAARVLAEGALAGVTALAGAHVDLRFPIGSVVADVGPLAASTDEFRITVIGLGGHAARPHEARDPIPAVAAIAIALQALTPDRRMDGHAAVCTVTEVHAGTAWNVIPERAELGGTLRATTPAARARLKSAVREIATSCAAQHHVEAEVTLVDGTPPLVNAAEPVAWAREVVTALLGPNALVPLPEPNLAGEDFASYAELLPAVFLRIGAREPHDPVVGAHSPRFLPSDAAIPVGAALLAAWARRASQP
ncbi:MAG: M20 family metallopeptidase [Gemmatimonadales bacterium]